tara:strand:+ start:175 stop:978 length:804 start_codon:yes stop_codon:yes gene_type:complete
MQRFNSLIFKRLNIFTFLEPKRVTNRLTGELLDCTVAPNFMVKTGHFSLILRVSFVMTFSVWLATAPLLMLLSLGPGPNNFTSMHNGIQVGATKAVIAVIGRNLAFSILMVVSALGLGAIIVSSTFWFSVIKWFGVVYLFYVGIKTWRSAAMVLEEHENEVGTKAKRGHLARMRQEFLVAIGNPKAVLLFTAIFPQLLDLSQPVPMQFFWMGVTFCMTEFIAAYIYAMSGKQIRRFIRSPKGMKNLNRGMGSVFVLASAFLATATRS